MSRPLGPSTDVRLVDAVDQLLSELDDEPDDQVALSELEDRALAYLLRLPDEPLTQLG